MITAETTNGRSNVIRLAIAQALAGANSVVAYATGAVVGDDLAPTKALATLPITVFVVGMALFTIPAGWIAARHGRRAAFMMGTGCGVLIGLFSATAVVAQSFPLLCLGMLCGGGYAAVVLSFRFVAAESVDPSRRSRALSLVMTGGVAAGVIGPQLVTHTMGQWPAHPFVTTYLAQALVALVAAGVLWGVNAPTPSAIEKKRGAPLSVIVRKPGFLPAVLCGAMSYLLMNLIMTSAPLAMKMHGLPMSASDLGIQWHVVAMYAPSLFTGRLIARFGPSRIAIVGLVLTAGAATVGLLGVDVHHFWGALILLGLGWNLAFLSASAMILEHQAPGEGARVQSLNDFVIFGVMVVGSFSSGGLLSSYGWSAVCIVAYPLLLLALVGLCTARR